MVITKLIELVIGRPHVRINCGSWSDVLLYNGDESLGTPVRDINQKAMFSFPVPTPKYQLLDNPSATVVLPAGKQRFVNLNNDSWTSDLYGIFNKMFETDIPKKLGPVNHCWFAPNLQFA